MTEFVSATNGLVVEMPPKTEACGGICRVRNPVEPPGPACAGFIISFDDGGWGPRNTLSVSDMSNLPEDFIPGSGQSSLLLVLGETTVEFYWDEFSEVYRNTDYSADPSGEEWPEASLMWGEGAETCVNVSFVPSGD